MSNQVKRYGREWCTRSRLASHSSHRRQNTFQHTETQTGPDMIHDIGVALVPFVSNQCSDSFVVTLCFDPHAAKC